MRFLILVLLFALVSCGQPSSSSSGSPSSKPEPEQREEEESEFNETVDTVTETDLLEAALDLPVEVTANKIVFQKTDAQMVEGIRANCAVAVEAGESWDYVLRGGALELYKGRKKQTYSRVGLADGIVGSWVWKGYEGRTFIIRRISFVSKTRVIMRANCEQ